MVFGAILLMQGEVTIGILVAFITLKAAVQSSEGLSRLLNTIYSASASAERVVNTWKKSRQSSIPGS